MGLSLHYGSHIPDAVGSIAIGGLLGSVALFMIRTNAFALVGRSIPEEKIQEINEDLEGDIMVRQIMDVKGMDMGNGIVRYVYILMLLLSSTLYSHFEPRLLTLKVLCGYFLSNVPRYMALCFQRICNTLS